MQVQFILKYFLYLIDNKVRSIFGVNERQGPFTGSAIVEWKYDDVPPGRSSVVFVSISTI